MRRALLFELPALSYHFHIHPWQIELLTEAEVQVYLAALHALQKGGD